MQPLIPKAPPSLFEMQDWFQSVLTLPIDEDNQIVTTRSIEAEAQNYIHSSECLSSKQRISIYHQQYWWRLLSCLHQIFPTLVRLFGFTDFNLSLGVPYLTKYQPRYWSLAQLGLQMPKWIEETYLAKDKTLILSSALLDLAYDEVFGSSSPKKISLSPDLLKTPLVFQPHVKHFALPFDLFAFRTALLKEDPTFWLDHDFPPLLKKGTYYSVLYKNQNQVLLHQKITEGHWILLDFIQKGMNIEQACDSLESLGGNPYEEAKRELPTWINTWISKSWLNPNQIGYDE